MKLRTTSALCWILMVPSAAQADPAADAVERRFAECYAAETGESLSGPLVDAVRAVAGQLAESVDPEVCADHDSGVCIAAIVAADCDVLADAWTGAVLPPMPDADAPAWARTFAAAIGDRISACYAEEMDTELTASERTAVDAYTAQTAGAIGGWLDRMGCEVDVAAADACADEIRARPCGTLSGQLFEGMSGLTAPTGGCAALFDCDVLGQVDDLVGRDDASATGD